MAYRFTLACVERDGCFPKAETIYNSTISGQITDTNKTIELKEFHSFVNLVRCSPPEDYSEENIIVGEIRVLGDKMTCTIPGDGNRLYFEAIRRW